MKVKKLLTLLILSAVLAGCNVNGGSQSESKGGSNTSSSADVSSDSGDSSSDSGQQTVTLVSIEVTAPTKVTYLIGEEFSADGLVVTATMSDGTTQTVTTGYEISSPDMNTTGTKTVTVTYEGKTDSFDITVSKPTAWTDAEKANFEAACHGYVPTFFYGPDYGVGALTWTVGSSGAYYAEGGDIAVPEEGQEYPFKGIADLLVADGFEITTKPGDTATTYHYALLKPVTVEGKTRYIQARLAATNEQGNFAASGTFYIDFSDPYFYSWEETGWNAALKQALSSEIDFPELPDGLYEKAFARLVPLYIQVYGYCPVEVAGLGKDFDPAPILAEFENDNWEYAKGSLATDDCDYVAASKDGKFRIDIGLDQEKGTAKFTFKRLKAIGDNVKIVANQMGLKPFVFEIGATAASYYMKVELNEGETLPQLRDRFANLLTKDDAEYKFVLAASSDAEGEVKGDYVFEAPAESELPNIRVTLYADVDEGKEGSEDDVTYIGIIVREYTPFSDDLKNFATVLGFDPFDLLVDSRSGEYFIDIDIKEELTVDQMLAHYTGLLDADAELAEPVVGASKVADVTGQVDEAGVGYKYLSYANDSTLVIIYAAVKKDAETGEISRFVELIFQDYNPAPESAWVDKLSTALGAPLQWQNDRGCFYLGAPIAATMPEGQTYQSIASIYAGLLINADEELEQLSYRAGPSFYVLTLFGSEGYVNVQCFQNEETDPVTLSIFVYLFAHPEYDVIINGIGAAMAVNLVKVQDGVYAAQSENVNEGASLITYGERIATEYSEGADLVAASGLEFTFSKADSGMSDNNYIAVFTNPAGYRVEVILLGDENKLISGDVYIFVYEPSEGGDEGDEGSEGGDQGGDQGGEGGDQGGDQGDGE